MMDETELKKSINAINRVEEIPEEDIKIYECVPVWLAMSCQQTDKIRQLFKPEWCIRKEVAQMYQIILSNDDEIEISIQLQPFFSDPYIEQARTRVNYDEKISLIRLSQKLKDAFYYRERNQIIAKLLQSPTPGARLYNIRRLQELEEQANETEISGVRFVDMTNRTPPTEYCLKFENIFWCPKKELTAIKGRAKHGKSHLLSIMMGAMLGRKEACGVDVANHGKRLNVLYVDTEQGMNSTEKIAEIAYNFAGLDAGRNYDFFNLMNLRTVKKTDRKKAIKKEVESCSRLKNGQKYDVVIIDGIKDLCIDFNDLKEADAILVELLGLADTYNLSVIGVLHENPSGDNNKMRGHLGTEFENKAFEIFESKKIDDVYNCINTERREKLVPTFAFYFDENDNLISCAPNDGKAKTSEEKEPKEITDFRLLSKAWANNPNVSMTKEEIIKILVPMALKGMKETNIKTKLEHYTIMKKIQKDETTDENGKKYFRYSLLDRSFLQ